MVLQLCISILADSGTVVKCLFYMWSIVLMWYLQHRDIRRLQISAHCLFSFLKWGLCWLVWLDVINLIMQMNLELCFYCHVCLFEIIEVKEFILCIMTILKYVIVIAWHSHLMTSNPMAHMHLKLNCEDFLREIVRPKKPWMLNKICIVVRFLCLDPYRYGR